LDGGREELFIAVAIPLKPKNGLKMGHPTKNRETTKGTKENLALQFPALRYAPVWMAAMTASAKSVVPAVPPTSLVSFSFLR
jgi:hypothetical protein